MANVVEHYRGYSAPRWVRRATERLLRSLAPEHVANLESIVLTNSRAIGKGRTGRVGGRKFRRGACRGFYHRATRDNRAWIEIVVDSSIGVFPSSLFWLRFFQDLLLAQVLYHEVGHHLDATIGSATRGGEAAAEDWRKRLSRIHFRRRYWYLRPLVPVVRYMCNRGMAYARQSMAAEGLAHR